MNNEVLKLLHRVERFTEHGSYIRNKQKKKYQTTLTTNWNTVKDFFNDR
jgi:hypothetical protein